jgi:hypothetical protein
VAVREFARVEGRQLLVLQVYLRLEARLVGDVPDYGDHVLDLSGVVQDGIGYDFSYYFRPGQAVSVDCPVGPAAREDLDYWTVLGPVGAAFGGDTVQGFITMKAYGVPVQVVMRRLVGHDDLLLPVDDDEYVRHAVHDSPLVFGALLQGPAQGNLLPEILYNPYFGYDVALLVIDRGTGYEDRYQLPPSGDEGELVGSADAFRPGLEVPAHYLLVFLVHEIENGGTYDLALFVSEELRECRVYVGHDVLAVYYPYGVHHHAYVAVLPGELLCLLLYGHYHLVKGGGDFPQLVVLGGLDLHVQVAFLDRVCPLVELPYGLYESPAEKNR